MLLAEPFDLGGMAMKAWLLTPLAVALGSCGASEEFKWHPQGGVTITATPSVKTCGPILYRYVVAPLQTSVGGKLSMRAEASDDGGVVSLVWSGTGGEIRDALGPETSYTCATAGPQQLTLTATNGNGCSSVERISVNCW